MSQVLCASVGPCCHGSSGCESCVAFCPWRPGDCEQCSALCPQRSKAWVAFMVDDTDAVEDAAFAAAERAYEAGDGVSTGMDACEACDGESDCSTCPCNPTPPAAGGLCPECGGKGHTYDPEDGYQPCICITDPTPPTSCPLFTDEHVPHCGQDGDCCDVCKAEVAMRQAAVDALASPPMPLDLQLTCAFRPAMTCIALDRFDWLTDEATHIYASNNDCLAPDTDPHPLSRAFRACDFFPGKHCKDGSLPCDVCASGLPGDDDYPDLDVYDPIHDAAVAHCLRCGKAGQADCNPGCWVWHEVF